MPVIKFNPSGFKRNEIYTSGHKFYHFIPGWEYEILDVCGRTGFKVKDTSGLYVWVSKRNLKDYFPGTNYEQCFKEFRKK